MRKKNAPPPSGLFEPAPAPVEPATAPKAKKPKALVTRCIDAFYAAYVRRHNPQAAEQWLQEMADGVPVTKRSTPQSAMILPMISGAKDGALLQKMVAAYGEERVFQLIEDFFGDAYTMFGVINSNQDIGALFKAAPKMLVRDHAALPSKKTANNLEAAARAMGRRPTNLQLALPKRTS